MASIPLTPLTALQRKQGCLSCLSKTELLQLKVFFLAKLYERVVGQVDFATMKDEAACLGCESDSALAGFDVAIWQAVAELTGATWHDDATGEDIPVGDMTPAQLKLATKCYPCISPKGLRAVMMWLLYYDALALSTTPVT